MPYVDATFLQNTTSLTAGPAFLNLLDKALLRLANPGVSSADITVYSYPLPMTVLETQAGQRLGALGASIIIVLCMAFIPAAFIVFIVRVCRRGQVHLCPSQAVGVVRCDQVPCVCE